jgi:uncharacterized protein YcbX
VLNAPACPEIRTPLDGDATPATPAMAATVWRDTVDAIDTGAETAAWLTQFVGTPLKLARFGDGARRGCNRKWTGDVDTHTQFADGYPLLVIGQSSLDDLNARLAAKGAPAIPMNRFARTSSCRTSMRTRKTSSSISTRPARRPCGCAS